jgi:type III secretory pathway component EscR
LHDSSKTVSQADAFVPEFKKVRAHYRQYLTPNERRDVDEYFDQLELKKHTNATWAALVNHEVTSARAHAREVVRLDPYCARSWKLMLCALRGH